MDEKEQAIIIYDFIKKVEHHWENGSILTEPFTVDQSHIELAEKLDSYAENFEILKARKIISVHALSVDDEVIFIIDPPRNQACYFTENMDDLLELKSCIINRPENIIVENLNYISWKKADDIPLQIEAYFSVCDQINRFLDLNIIEVKRDEYLLLIFGGQTFTFLAQTDDKTLEKYSKKIIDGSTQTLQILSDTIHMEDKKRIIRAVLSGYIKALPEDRRFEHMLCVQEEIAKNISENYDLFISEFSFELENEKILSQQNEFSRRLGGVLSSIQTKILAVPVSLILAYGQMKTSDNSGYLLVNTSVLAAALIFSVLLWILLHNQEFSLTVIKDELDQKTSRLRTKFPGLFAEMNEGFDNLNKQYSLIRITLCFLYGLIIAGFAATIFFYIRFSFSVKSIYQFIIQLCKS